MHYRKGTLAIMICLGLALVLWPLSIASGNGAVTVGIDAPAEVDPGSTFVANVTVNWVADFDSCGFDVTYDKTVITVFNVTGGVLGGHNITVGPGDWTYIPPGAGDTGRVRVITVRAGPPRCGLNGTGYLAQIHFRAIGSGGSSSSINLQNVGMYDCRAAAITTSTLGDSVVIKAAPPARPTVAFSSSTYSVGEGAGTVPIAVVLSAASTQTVTVQYATTGGNATAGADYTAVSGTLSFSPGVTSRTFNVPILEDTSVEGSETVNLVLSSPTNATLGTPSTAVLTIIDNDATPPVGGTAFWPNKLLMVLPWIAFGAAIIVAASLLLRRRSSATR